MGAQVVNDWQAESAASIAARLDAAKASQGQTRVTLGSMAVISAMMLIACYNAYFSYDYFYLASSLKRPVTSDALSDVLLAQAAKDWATARTIQIGLLGVRVSVDDVAVLGTAVLAVLSFWLVLVTRRENHTIGFLLRDTDATLSEARPFGTDDRVTGRQEIAERRWQIFHTIAANSLFETPNTSLFSVNSLQEPNRWHLPGSGIRDWIGRHGFGVLRNFFFFFPVITSLIIFSIDRYSYFLPDPFEPNGIPKGMNDEFFLPSAVVYLVLLIPLGLCCRKANSFSHGTETVLREYCTSLMNDLNRATGGRRRA